MKIKDIMTNNVVSVKLETPVTEVTKIIKDNNVGSVPVCDGQRVVGIVTDRDIVLRGIAMDKDINTLKAKDVMTAKVTTVDSNSDVNSASNIMAEKQIRRLPVVDGNNLVGIVSIGDIAVRNNLQDNAGDALSDISKPSNSLF
ncbi:MAG TPA: CBS domain-containing protein [Clostridiaceae bacterium]|jgi:CBS domain-containing protein|nr:CBS domain-containing protein [Clostridiaceae bacterium]HBG38593.1 CBS domain-containing protein [Clostridiaceae bacterium]